jgi:hypothetical protein
MITMDAPAVSEHCRRSGPVARVVAIVAPPIAASALACFVAIPWRSESPRGIEHAGTQRAWFEQQTALIAAPTPADRSMTPPRRHPLDLRTHVDWWTINQRLRIRLDIPGVDPIELEVPIPGQEPNGRYPLLFDGITN